MATPNGTRYETANELWDRMSRAVGGHDVDWQLKSQLLDALQALPDSIVEDPDLTWEKIPEDVRQLVEQCEARPPTSWDDPLDVPDDTSYMD